MAVMWSVIFYTVLAVAAFYFILLQPVLKNQREQRKAVQQLRIGDEVVTTGGLIGEVKDVVTPADGPTEIILELAPNIRVRAVTDVHGGLTGDQIRRVIQRNVSQVQHCYEQGLQRNPSLAGRVTVAFMITPTGSVGGSSVADNSLGDAAVGTCVAGAVRRWAFPQPDPAGPVSVRFPFNLTQSGGG